MLGSVQSGCCNLLRGLDAVAGQQLDPGRKAVAGTGRWTLVFFEAAGLTAFF